MRIGRTFVALGCSVALLATACTDADDRDESETSTTERTATSDGSAPTTAPAADVVSASGLRTTLDLALVEHAVLATDATGAALGGRTAEYDAAVSALGENSRAIADAVGSVYGPDAGEAFLALWERHIGFFVDYTTALAEGDQAAADEAAASLAAYAGEFGAFLESANPELPEGAVEELVTTHVSTLLAVIDAQAAGDPATAYASLQAAVDHMPMIGDALAGAVVAQFPDRFVGDPASATADLRVTLNLLLAEHAVLALDATGAALGGRTAEYDAAVSALGENSRAIADAVGSVYGPDAGEAFLALWERHIGFFVDYTTALAEGDQAAADEAAASLAAYAGEFGAFLESANPELPEGAVEELVTTHVSTLLAVIDAQAEADPATAYADFVEAFAHMRMIADALTESIAAQFPDRFPSEAGAVGGDDDDGASPSTTATADPGEVLAQTFQFQPESITVSAGDAVTWTNLDDTDHQPTSGTPEAPTGDFQVLLAGEGSTGSTTLDTPGTYPYFCQIHTSMLGTIVVE